MEEIWKDISGYDGAYQVSNLGNVRSVDRINARGAKIKGVVLTRRKNITSDYYQVALSKNGKHKLVYVHRLVALAFVPNEFGLPIINHKDEDKWNNSYDNLEWCDYRYNLTYGKMSRENRSKRLVGEHHPNRKLCADDVLNIRKLYKGNGGKYSAGEISKMYGICRDQAWKIATRKSWWNV